MMGGGLGLDFNSLAAAGLQSQAQILTFSKEQWMECQNEMSKHS
jgi:hypothetical protein